MSDFVGLLLPLAYFQFWFAPRSRKIEYGLDADLKEGLESAED